MDSPREREGCEEGEEACDVCSRKGEDWFKDSGIGSSQAMDGVSMTVLKVEVVGLKKIW